MILSGSCGGSGAGECGGKRKAQEHEGAESRCCHHRGESSAGRWGGGERSVGLSSSGGGQGASVGLATSESADLQAYEGSEEDNGELSRQAELHKRKRKGAD